MIKQNRKREVLCRLTGPGFIRLHSTSDREQPKSIFLLRVLHPLGKMLKRRFGFVFYFLFLLLIFLLYIIFRVMQTSFFPFIPLKYEIPEKKFILIWIDSAVMFRLTRKQIRTEGASTPTHALACFKCDKTFE